MEKQNDIFDHLKPREIFTPDQAYFDQLATNVISTAKSKVIPLYKKPVFWMTAAAACITVVLLLNIGTTSKTSENVLLAMNEIPQHEVLEYVKQNIKEFDTEMLSEIIPENNIEEIKFSTQIEEKKSEPLSEPQINFDNIDQEDILNYLYEEDIDINDLEDLNEFIN